MSLEDWSLLASAERSLLSPTLCHSSQQPAQRGKSSPCPLLFHSEATEV